MPPSSTGNKTPPQSAPMNAPTFHSHVFPRGKAFSHLIVALAALVVTPLIHAESSVWKVTRGEETIYLGGTCHTLRPSDLPIPAEYSVAFDASDVLFFETDLAAMQSPETQGKLLAQAALPQGKTLPKVLSEEAWAAVDAYCGKAGIPTVAIQNFKPSMVVLTIFAIEAQRMGFTPEGVDVQLHKKAHAAGKPTQGLETVDEQIAFIMNLGEGQEDQLVISTLRDMERLPALLGDLVAAWRTGDLQKIDTLMSGELRKEFPKIYEELLVQRNKAWLPEIETMLASDPTEFVLVGVAHLAGEDGLLHALKQAGCSIEQVKAAN